MGVFDPDDWNWTDNWCEAESQTFEDRPLVTWSAVPPDSLLIACFPNPTGSEFILGFYRDDPSYVDIRFVDDSFQLLWELDSMTTNARVVHTDSLGITEPGIIRVLYRVVHADGTAHHGHGDLQVDP